MKGKYLPCMARRRSNVLAQSPNRPSYRQELDDPDRSSLHRIVQHNRWIEVESIDEKNDK